MHIHRSSKNDSLFICWASKLPTMESALNILKFWAVGAVYVIENGGGFASLATDEEFISANFKEALERIKERHGISAEIKVFDINKK